MAKSNTERVKRIIRFVEQLTVPSGVGEGGQFKLRRSQRKFIQDVYGRVDKNGNRVVRRAIYSIARKNGKGLALDTPIPTPSGWTTMGDIQIGDVLFDEKGNQCNVTYISENRFIDCYEIEFSNGEKIICDGDHLWETTARVDSPGSKKIYPRIKTQLKRVRDTREIFKTQRYSKRNDVNHSIAMPDPIQCDHVDLPVDPYVLGVWLGDGKSDSARVSCGAQDLHEMISFFNECGVDTIPRQDKSCYMIQLSGGRYGHKSDKINQKLRLLGVFNNKHIPSIYLRASFNQRLSLLQGLMDTDGTCDSRGRAQEFCTIKTNLLIGFCELLSSFGIKYSVRVRPLRCNGNDVGGVGYYVQFCANRDYLPVFRLKRKLERQKSNGDISPRSRSVQIVSVKKVDSVYTKCIQVDSPNSLFLCGKTFIPTHNTAIIACLVLAHLIGPEAIMNGEIYSAANDRDQASIVFKYAAQIVRADPELMSLIKIVDSTKTMVCFGNGSVYRAISAEAGTKHGLNPTVVIFDELAQAKNRELYDALDTSMAARQEPLFIVISTQSDDPQHLLSQLIDDGLRANDPSTVCHLYAVPDDAENVFTDEKLWRMANPALGDFRSMQEMRTAAKRAQRMPSFEASFRNLYLNQRVNSETPLIPRAEWIGCQQDGACIHPDTDIYLGLDLSSKTDLTALVAISAGDKSIVQAWFWKPGDTLDEHETRDRVPYFAWKQKGIIEVTPGRAIQYDWVAERLVDIVRSYHVLGMAYDRWRIEDLLNAMGKIGLDAYVDKKDEQRSDALRLVPWGQGYADMSPAVEALETAVLDRVLVHNGNPCLTWNISNAMTIQDAAGNKKLDKSKTRFRIDGAVALAMALGLKSRDMSKIEPSIYETRGVLTF